MAYTYEYYLSQLSVSCGSCVHCVENEEQDSEYEYFCMEKEKEIDDYADACENYEE